MTVAGWLISDAVEQARIADHEAFRVDFENRLEATVDILVAKLVRTKAGVALPHGGDFERVEADVDHGQVARLQVVPLEPADRERVGQRRAGDVDVDGTGEGRERASGAVTPAALAVAAEEDPAAIEAPDEEATEGYATTLPDAAGANPD